MPGQATWSPLLSTASLSWSTTGKRSETYYPIAVADGKFHCIILKGDDRYPYFPRPLLSEFELEVPVSSSTTERGAAEGEASDKIRQLEEQHLRLAALHALASDAQAATRTGAAQRAALARQELEIDKVLLQLLAAECVEAEERGMKCLEIVGLMRDRSGRMLDAAAKVAGRFGRDTLRAKIRDVEERRVVGLEGGDDGDGEPV